jgi:hypothetical protein
LGSERGSEWGIVVIRQLKSKMPVETTHLTEAKGVLVDRLISWGANVEKLFYRGPTLDEYFRTKHNVRLNFPSCPCGVERGTECRFPYELLRTRITPGARRLFLGWYWEQARTAQQADADGAFVEEVDSKKPIRFKCLCFALTGITLLITEPVLLILLKK